MTETSILESPAVINIDTKGIDTRLSPIPTHSINDNHDTITTNINNNHSNNNNKLPLLIQNNGDFSHERAHYDTISQQHNNNHLMDIKTIQIGEDHILSDESDSSDCGGELDNNAATKKDVHFETPIANIETDVIVVVGPHGNVDCSSYFPSSSLIPRPPSVPPPPTPPPPPPPPTSSLFDNNNNDHNHDIGDSDWENGDGVVVVGGDVADADENEMDGLEEQESENGDGLMKGKERLYLSADEDGHCDDIVEDHEKDEDVNDNEDLDELANNVADDVNNIDLSHDHPNIDLSHDHPTTSIPTIPTTFAPYKPRKTKRIASDIYMDIHQDEFCVEVTDDEEDPEGICDGLTRRVRKRVLVVLRQEAALNATQQQTTGQGTGGGNDKNLEIYASGKVGGKRSYYAFPKSTIDRYRRVAERGQTSLYDCHGSGVYIQPKSGRLHVDSPGGANGGNGGVLKGFKGQVLSVSGGTTGFFDEHKTAKSTPGIILPVAIIPSRNRKTAKQNKSKVFNVPETKNDSDGGLSRQQKSALIPNISEFITIKLPISKAQLEREAQAKAVAATVAAQNAQLKAAQVAQNKANQLAQVALNKANQAAQKAAQKAGQGQGGQNKGNNPNAQNKSGNGNNVNNNNNNNSTTPTSGGSSGATGSTSTAVLPSSLPPPPPLPSSNMANMRHTKPIMTYQQQHLALLQANLRPNIHGHGGHAGGASGSGSGSAPGTGTGGNNGAGGSAGMEVKQLEIQRQREKELLHLNALQAQIGIQKLQQQQ
ncbi:hypothetical protein HDU76_013933, partial [Blyttiomyces sp. JEL0837]